MAEYDHGWPLVLDRYREQLATLGRETSTFGTNGPALAAREAQRVEPRLAEVRRGD